MQDKEILQKQLELVTLRLQAPKGWFLGSVVWWWEKEGRVVAVANPLA